MFDTVITITIATMLSLFFVRLVVQMCLDSACDRYQSIPHWLLRLRIERSRSCILPVRLDEVRVLPNHRLTTDRA